MLPSLSVVPRRVMRCPGEKVQVRVPEFICGYERVCVCVCHQNTQYASITQADMKSVRTCAKQVSSVLSLLQMNRNTVCKKADSFRTLNHGDSGGRVRTHTHPRLLHSHHSKQNRHTRAESL